MNIQAEKYNWSKYFWILKTPKQLSPLKNLKKEKASDFWNDLSEQQRKEIEKAYAEIENGDVTHYESFMLSTDN